MKNQGPGKIGGRKPKRPSQLASPSVAKKIYNFIALIEQLPYGASLMQEKKVARVAMGTGLLIMATGSSLFSAGWWMKVNWLVETAFVITLIGWMMLIIGFAFWVVSSFAKNFPVKRSRN